VIVILLLASFLEVVFINIDPIKWELLILPISIVLIAIGLKILKLNKEENIKNS
jgi:ABC-type multidrug transport system permease subunit